MTDSQRKLSIGMNQKEGGKLEQLKNEESEVYSALEKNTAEGLQWTRRKLLTALGTTGIAIAAGGAFMNLLNSDAHAEGKDQNVVESVYGTLQSKKKSTTYLSDVGWVNVVDYGAVGDGSTDDTIAFQSAAASGKPIVVPAPVSYYKLTGSVTLTNSIVGVGMPEIRMDQSDGSAGKRMFLIINYNGNGLTVNGLYLNGGYSSGTQEEQAHLVRIVNSKNVYVHNNWLHAPYGDCVYVGSDYIAPSENVYIRENILSNPRRCAVAIVSGRKVWVVRNVISDPYPYVAAIDLEPNSTATNSDLVEDVWIEDNEFYSEIYFINSYNPNVQHSNRRITIAGNKGKSRFFFRCNAAPSITQDVTIRGNEFYGSISDARMIQCSNVVRGLEISNNRDYSTGASGWNIANSASPVVKDNRIESIRAIAVSFTNCSSIQFSGNLIKDINSSYGAVRFAGPQPTGRHQITGNQLVNIGNLGYWFGGVVTDSLFDGNVSECAGKCVQIDAAANGSDLRITTDNVFAGTGTPVVGGTNIRTWTTPEIQTKGIAAGWASSAPASGIWKRGSILWNVQPSTLAPVGWVCLTDGTPGVWESIGYAGAVTASNLKLKSANGTIYNVSVTDAGELTVTLA